MGLRFWELLQGQRAALSWHMQPLLMLDVLVAGVCIRHVVTTYVVFWRWDLWCCAVL
jgi:hypothetical protein